MARIRDKRKRLRSAAAAKEAEENASSLRIRVRAACIVLVGVLLVVSQNLGRRYALPLEVGPPDAATHNPSSPNTKATSVVVTSTARTATTTIEAAASVSKPATATTKAQHHHHPWPSEISRALDTQDPEKNRLLRLGEGTPGWATIADTKGFLPDHLDEFLAVYEGRPDPSNVCGGRITHQLALYAITKRLRPTTIIESGINSGQSTYTFRMAAGNATKIISIDPSPKPICNQMGGQRWIDSTNNEYLTGGNFVDFEEVDWASRIEKGEIDPETTLVFLDDHQGFYKRFPTLVKHGFRHLVNDDNYKVGGGSTAGDKSGASPKQMWRDPASPATRWLADHLRVYGEFPPVFSPQITEGKGWKRHPEFLYHTDDYRDLEEPLLRPTVNPEDEKVFQQIVERLKLDLYRKNRWDYFELMNYCYICYIQLEENPPPPPPLEGSTRKDSF